MRKYKQEPYTVPPWIYNAIQVLRPVERLTVSEWAAKYRVLPDGNAIPGPWSNSVTPYLVEIMDTFSDDMVVEIVFVKPTQVGGTSAMENMLGSLIAQDPAPAMVVYPSDDLAERTTESKLEPMVKSCKVLADKWRKNDSKKLALKFSDMTVYLTGANSPADLASTNIRYLFLDEVDKFPGASKKEADPVSLARERTVENWPSEMHTRRIADSSKMIGSSNAARMPAGTPPSVPRSQPQRQLQLSAKCAHSSIGSTTSTTAVGRFAVRFSGASIAFASGMEE